MSNASKNTDILRQMREKIAPHYVQHFGEEGVPKGIEHLVPRLSVVHQSLRAQDRKVLGDVGWLDIHVLKDGSDRQFSIAQSFDNMDSGGMRQHLKDVGFKFSQRVQAACFNHQCSFH